MSIFYSIKFQHSHTHGKIQGLQSQARILQPEALRLDSPCLETPAAPADGCDMDPWHIRGQKNMAVCFDNICDDQPILDVLYLDIFYWKVNSWIGIACLYSAPQLPFNHQLAVPLKMSSTYKAPQLTLHARMLGVKTFPAKATIVVLYDMWFIDEIALSVICVLHVYI